MTDFAGYTFNIIKRRGDPTEAETLTGHRVKKEPFVYFTLPDGSWASVQCADYHNEHFVYLDPLPPDDKRSKGHWFAMCTCGAPAVIVGPGTALSHETNADKNMLVCYVYMLTLQQYGVGRHATGDGRRWW